MARQGFDFCPQQEFHIRYNIELLDDHIVKCPICIRRWRILQAQLFNWQPATHQQARWLMEAMTEIFADGRSHRREHDYQAFYAHLATCEACEQEFSISVALKIAFDQIPAPPNSPGESGPTRLDDGGDGPFGSPVPHRPSSGPAAAAVALTE